MQTFSSRVSSLLGQCGLNSLVSKVSKTGSGNALKQAKSGNTSPTRLYTSKPSNEKPIANCLGDAAVCRFCRACNACTCSVSRAFLDGKVFKFGTRQVNKVLLTLSHFCKKNMKVCGYFAQTFYFLQKHYYTYNVILP